MRERKIEFFVCENMQTLTTHFNVYVAVHKVSFDLSLLNLKLKSF